MAADDLVVKILAKLPVKSLLRFSCATKTWYSTISDSHFSNNLHRMRSCFLLCENLTNFSTINTDPTMQDKPPTPLPLPWETESDSEITFLGSCNGLICVDHKSSSSSSSGISGLIVWNPSTRKFKRVPYPMYYLCDTRVLAYIWFGYDESIDDYKLVWLSFNCLNHGPRLAELEVLTLKSNTWESRSVEHIPVCGTTNVFQDAHRLNDKTIGVLSNGAIHWIIPNGSDECIMAFDLATEKFRLLNFSLGGLHWIGSLGGCLSLSSQNRGGGRRVLWVMKEYGVESSWSKLLWIDLLALADDSFLSFYPLLFSTEEGKEVVAVCNGQFLHNGNLGLSGRIVQFRVEGAKKVKFEKTLLCVRTYGYDGANNVIILHDLHMEESLVRI